MFVKSVKILLCVSAGSFSKAQFRVPPLLVFYVLSKGVPSNFVLGNQAVDCAAFLLWWRPILVHPQYHLRFLASALS
ncbi:hypothetical protein F9L33_14550 [Amylibacter sp. SFDW26]|uniref:hypothetical protein n=1 Tax=Amylibacter sp. SFDW26 TaxID=2652722 RepID=UPI0012617521|nr:hypothetical protein [Amylibacter sp. SFDW26]KAB7610516.1 hypothetical protein F9L33_14550 [Amylibacter sp. SFDW26]